MPKPAETDFKLASGEEVFTFEALQAARANMDEFEEVGTANTGDKDGLKGQPTLDLDKGNFSNRIVFRRKVKSTGKIGKELLK